jgi:hypothetical protein
MTHGQKNIKFQGLTSYLKVWNNFILSHGFLPVKILLNIVAGNASRHTFTTESLRTLHRLHLQHDKWCNFSYEYLKKSKR